MFSTVRILVIARWVSLRKLASSVPRSGSGGGMVTLSGLR